MTSPRTNRNDLPWAGRGPRRPQMLILALSCVAALLALAALAVALGSAARASPIVYAACLAACLILLTGAFARLVATPGEIARLVLPIGLPCPAPIFVSMRSRRSSLP